MGRSLPFRGEVSRGSANPTRPRLPVGPTAQPRRRGLGRRRGRGRGLQLARERGTAAVCLEAGRLLPG